MLEHLYDKYNRPEFIEPDPISVPHAFEGREDREIAGFLAATIAWGNRKAIVRSARRMVEYMDNAPADFVRNASDAELARLQSYVHRTFNGGDFRDFVMSLRHITELYGGIGALIKKLDTTGVIISQPYAGSPAVKYGLEPGDVILKINGEDVLPLNAEECSSRMKGEPGTKVKFLVRKGRSSKTGEIEVVRERIHIPDVSYSGILQDSIGYIKIDGFTVNGSEDVKKAVVSLKEKGAKHFMLHTMVASNELDASYIVETARMLFMLVNEIRKKTGIIIERVDLGGGVGIPYRPEDKAISFEKLGDEIHRLYKEMVDYPLKVSFEMGRAITGPYGYLVTRVRHVAHKYKDYVGVDATMADLMRPAMYGAYHHITVPGKDDWPHDHKYDVTGSLCENNDKFAIDRMLPELERGDLLIIHDTGAHGHSMGFNYNGKLRHAEYLIRKDGSIAMIRRAETIEDYLRTQLDEPLEI